MPRGNPPWLSRSQPTQVLYRSIRESDCGRTQGDTDDRIYVYINDLNYKDKENRELLTTVVTESYKAGKSSNTRRTSGATTCPLITANANHLSFSVQLIQIQEAENFKDDM